MPNASNSTLSLMLDMARSIRKPKRHHPAHYPCLSTINKRFQTPLTRRTKLRNGSTDNRFLTGINRA
jgi:hypothetical protein